MTPRFIISVRQAAAVLFAASALLAAACADSASPIAPSTGGTPATNAPGNGNPGTPGTPNAATIAGVYRLAEVEGHSVPCVFDAFSPAPGQKMEMRAMRGEIRLNDDGTYTEEFETQLSGTMLKNDIVTVKTFVGMYTLQGTTLTLSPLDGTPFTASYASGRIDLVTEAPGVNGGMDRRTFTFRR